MKIDLSEGWSRPSGLDSPAVKRWSLPQRRKPRRSAIFNPALSAASPKIHLQI